MWLRAEDILHFEEIETLVDVFTGLGVDKVRLTGGEPLLHRDVPDLVQPRRSLGDSRSCHDDQRRPARGQRPRPARADCTDDRQPRHPAPAALPRPDPLRRDGSALRWHRHARCPAVPGLKLDTVVINGVNDDKLIDLLEFGRPIGAEVRFIEYMDVGGAALVDAAGDGAARCCSTRAALRADRAGDRGVIGARRSIPSAGRPDVWDHLFYDRAVLRRTIMTG